MTDLNYYIELLKLAAFWGAAFSPIIMLVVQWQKNLPEAHQAHIQDSEAGKFSAVYSLIAIAIISALIYLGLGNSLTDILAVLTEYLPMLLAVIPTAAGAKVVYEGAKLTGAVNTNQPKMLGGSKLALATAKPDWSGVPTNDSAQPEPTPDLVPAENYNNMLRAKNEQLDKLQAQLTQAQAMLAACEDEKSSLAQQLREDSIQIQILEKPNEDLPPPDNQTA